MTLRACVVCGRTCEGPRSRCPNHGGNQTNRQTLTTTQRGYGSTHQRRRAALLPQAHGTTCPLCNEPMTANQHLNLHHTVALVNDASSVGDRIVHADCDRRHGALLSERGHP